MIDTMSGVKVVGGFCGAFLVFLLAKWGAELVYHVGPAGHGEQEAGYVIAVADAPADAAPEEAGPTFDEVWPTADAAAGEAVFRNCRACHSIEDGKNGTGPSLYGVVGREVDTEAGYDYSGALLQTAEIWTPDQLYDFLADPRGDAPGTKMTFAGLRSPQDRVDLIAWLDTLDD